MWKGFQLTPVMTQLLASWFTDLSAAWAAAIIVFSSWPDLRARADLSLLLLNASAAIVALVAAYKLQQRV